MANDPNDLAYPREGYYDKERYRHVPTEDGLSKVELIAAMALQGMLANPNAGLDVNILTEVSVDFAFMLLEKVDKISYDKKVQQLHKKK